MGESVLGVVGAGDGLSVAVTAVGFRVRTGLTGAIVKTGLNTGDTGINVSTTGASEGASVTAAESVGDSVGISVGVSVGDIVGGVPSDSHSHTLIRSGIN